MTEVTVEGRFAEQMAGLIVPIDSVRSHPDNPRRGDVEKLSGSLARFGQTKPILVQKSTGYIAAGNHTHRAAVALGWTHIARVEMDWDDETTRAYLVADNRLSDVATNDDAALATILEQLMLDGKLEGTGYSAEDVDDLMSAMDMLSVVDSDFEGEHRESAEETASRYREPGEVRPMRQFVFLYPEDTGSQVEQDIKRLQKVWGVGGARDVVAEAVHRCAVACEDNNSEVGCTCLQVTEQAAF